ncbi:MAG: beta-galactosidase [Kiritimatiellaeota bacterium]|nr:beta-galactosidase [Kiritimatiellota bacterium]
MKKQTVLWHGGDYNPDQWRDEPKVIDEDFRLFEKARINSASVGIFAWTALEPEEGKFTFGWLDDIMERAARQGMAIVLATPSGAKPHWMAAKYPEVRRMNHPDGFMEPLREVQASRHNHCFTSPMYRAKCVEINTRLAERYKGHPALAMWHVSNEYGGTCHCPLCYAAFQKWLKQKYGTLAALNEAWWSRFWSHEYTAWEQINVIDSSVEGLRLDWQRFTTDQTVDFFRAESAPLRKITPEIPVTVNMMGLWDGLDYWKFAPYIDVVSWDNYPRYHDRPGITATVASGIGLAHDFNRSLKGGQPFLMMESAPGPVNWQEINRQLRPGVHRLKSIQAIAHGSDSVQYFQLRKGRGGCEKFHAAVIDHVGHGDTRMFREVTQVGEDLEKLTPIVGARTPARVGIFVDWESRWALDFACGPSAVAKAATTLAQTCYQSYWSRGVGVDVLNGDASLDGYDIVVAPSLYMLREGLGERVEAFVKKGGVFVATYLTGVADETGRAFRGGFPGPLRKALGIWSEEIDYLYPDEVKKIRFGQKRFDVRNVCEVIHLEGAKAMATYEGDYYDGMPAVTMNTFGKGEAWYIAADGGFTLADYVQGRIMKRQRIAPALPSIPADVTVQVRENANGKFTFVSNFASVPKRVNLGKVKRRDLLGGKTVSGTVTLPAYGVLVLAEPKDQRSIRLKSI